MPTALAERLCQGGQHSVESAKAQPEQPCNHWPQVQGNPSLLSPEAGSSSSVLFAVGLGQSPGPVG